MMREQINKFEEDLVDLCEDNEQMKEAIKGYFARCREENDFGSDFPALELKNQKALGDYWAMVESGEFDEWAKALLEFLKMNSATLSEDTIKNIVKDFLWCRIEEIKEGLK